LLRSSRFPKTQKPSFCQTNFPALPWVQRIIDQTGRMTMDNLSVTTTASSSWPEENSTSNITAVPTVSGSSQSYTTIFLIVISTLLLIFAAISAASNLLVLLAVYFERKLRSNFTTLIVNQAIADFMVSIIPMPLLTITILVGYWPFGRVMCGIWCVVDYSSTLASVYALVAICIDRLWATKWCHHYRKHNTRKKVMIMCGSVW